MERIQPPPPQERSHLHERFRSQRRPRPQERDPWYGYDHWRLGRVRVSRKAHLLLARRPVLVPALSLLVGVAVLAAGGILGSYLAESEANWVPALLLGLGAVAVVLGVGGLVSSLVVFLVTRGREEHEGPGGQGGPGENDGGEW